MSIGPKRNMAYAFHIPFKKDNEVIEQTYMPFWQ